MDIYVRSRKSPHRFQRKEYPCLELTRDNWNDYSYYTTFYVTLLVKNQDSSDKNDDQRIDLGRTRITYLGQTEGIENRPFEEIDEGQIIPKNILQKICSLGWEDGYYDAIQNIEIELARRILAALRDAAFQPEIREKFQSDLCFKTSLLRDSFDRERLDTAGERFGSTSQLSNSFSAQIKLDGASSPHAFKFDFRSDDGVPRRIHSIVGLNGVGKTQVMARLAMLLSRFSKKTVKENRSTLQNEDMVDPVPSIYNVVAVSFSAFDEFERPTPKQGQLFQYSYCGLQLNNGKLKTKDQLLVEIFNALKEEIPTEKRALLKSVLKNLVHLDDLDTFIEDPESNRDLYQKISAGQRLALNCVLHIITKIGPRTLILFDEPELHLHPQLVTGLLSALTEILENQDSFAIIATHSPLVVQQLPKECVHVIRRDRMTPMVLRPTFQTFGESISEITRHVFASPEAERDYRSVLERLFSESNGNIEEIRNLFSGQLSLNADIYLESLCNMSKERQ